MRWRACCLFLLLAANNAGGVTAKLQAGAANGLPPHPADLAVSQELRWRNLTSASFLRWRNSEWSPLCFLARTEGKVKKKSLL